MIESIDSSCRREFVTIRRFRLLQNPALVYRLVTAGRLAQAECARARVLEAAHRLFVVQGYSRTPVSHIAREAGVSAPTVFAGFRSKVALLKLAVDTAIVGDDEAVPLAACPVMRRVHEAATFAELVERLADAFAEVAERAAPIAYAAADADPEIAALVATIDEQRLAGAERLAGVVAERLGVTDPAVITRLRDSVWTLNSFAQWDLLVRQRGWAVTDYREWMVVALTAHLSRAGSVS